MKSFLKQSDDIAQPKLPHSLVADLLPKPEPKPEPEPVVLRDFGDAKATRKNIYDNVLKAAQKIEPVSNNRYSLHLSDVHYADPDHFPLSVDKEAILTGKSLQRRLRGTWHLKTPDGQEVANKVSTIANIPHMTDRGTFILGGSEYTLGHQMRLRPGVFTRQKESGELEAHLNAIPGKGLSHRYFLEPSTGVFKLNIGQASMPLLPLLKAMGATDDELKASWGHELLNANQRKDDSRIIEKLYDRVVSKKKEGATYEDKRKSVVEFMNNMEFDPEVTKRTLGHPHKNLTKDAAVDTTKKLLAVSRGEADTDDRDHMAYQTFLGPEDLLAERMGRDKRILHELLWKASTKGNLDTLPTGAYTKHVHDAIMGSGLGMSLEESNPTDVLDQQTRVSRLGKGGIESIDSIPDEARSVLPSQLGYVDLVRAPESSKIGVDSRVASGAKKGSDGRIYSSFIDNRTGQSVYKSPQDIVDSTVAFPNEMNQPKNLVAALKDGKTIYVPRDQVDYVMPHMEHNFSPISNLVPGKSGIKGQRAAMASRFTIQALPLENPESPHVRTQVPGHDNYSYEEHLSKHAGAVYSKNQPGRVLSVDDDGITVKYADGTTEKHETYKTFPFNRRTFLHNTPTVQMGDLVKPGQLLAKSNYTDDKGAIALGKNLRVAFVPFKAQNYEDAIVISESAAKKLTSEHMYQHDHEWDDNQRRGKKSYVSIFPGVFDKKVLANVDDEGVIKTGSVVQPGDPLVLCASERELSRKQIHSAHKGSFDDKTTTWDHHSPGVVTDVAKTDKGVTVAVKSYSPSVVGDKLSSRFGGKGVIGGIHPDDQMPHDESGKPYEILVNPLGTISRTNPTTIIEAALGKIAEKTGKHYTIEDFSKIPDLTEHAQKELAKHGLSDLETIVDPTTGRKIPNVMTGNGFFMKLQHQAEHKDQGRGLGSYTAEGAPSRGGEGGSKKSALMEISALASHGATEYLRDTKLIRGQKNQEYWSSYMSGFRPPTPPVPLVYTKFINMLKASGINVERHNDQSQIMGMTDKDIDALAGDRELENVETVDWKSGMAPIKGGLFDERLTGGHQGAKNWAKITLHEPMPNPVFEEPIRHLLGLTQKRFENVLAGRETFNEQSGPKAIQNALKDINLEQAITQAREDIKSGRKSLRDNAVRKLNYLKGAEKVGVHPKDWILSKVPVIPPVFRPVSIMQGSGGRLVSDANYLYKELFDANKALKNLSGKVEDVSNERLNLYNAFKGVTGLGDPIQPKNQERKVQGMLGHIFGSSPKMSFVQQKLIGTTVDLVGRAVVIPNPDLHMDQIGLPENKAWEVYTPFVVRRLVKKGVSRLQALEYVKNKHEAAKKALEEEVNERPVVMTRAPVLHRFGMMAFYPRLTKGDTLQVSPICTKSMGMDFDGNCILGATEIVVDINYKLLYSIKSDFHFRLEELIMSQTGKTAASWFEDGNSSIVMPIEKFPRTKPVNVNKNGQEIYEVPPGISIASYDHENGTTKLVPISRFTIDYNHPCVQVTTSRNRTLEVSDNESLCVYDNATGGLMKIKPSEAVGKLIPYLKKDIISGTKFDRELGWWYGSFVADGWSSADRVGYSKIAAEKRAEFVRIARSRICDNFISHEYYADKTTYSNKFVVSITVHLNGKYLPPLVLSALADQPANSSDRTSLFKKIPDELLFSGSREALLGLLTGLMEGDCCMTWNKALKKQRFGCRFNTSSPYLVSSLKTLLRKLGIRYSVTVSPPRNQSKEAYVVLPSLIDIYNIIGELKFIGKHEQQIAKDFLAAGVGRKNGETLDIIPVPNDLFEVLAAELVKIKQMTLYSAARKAIKQGKLGRFSANRLLELFPNYNHPQWAGFVTMVNNEDVHWEAVESVTDFGSHTVYDFEVPTKVFAVANGLVVYDTTNYHVPASDEAKQEAIDKMLPSKNLLTPSNFKAHYSPTMEMQGALHSLTRPANQTKKPRLFATKGDALKAYNSGQLDPSDPITIMS
jgi:DNA-directed RNA polymerase beta subunit/DNA-directed RNA polymerase beta' subunit